MKKGFTLIEIIGIIILLSLIGLLVYPTIMRIIGDSKEDLYQKNISEIERMAANWASINEDKLPKVDKRGYYLKIEEMEKEGFIDGDVTNPKTGEAMQGCVGIIYNEEKNRHDYKYYDDCENFVKPILSNLVANVVENEYGWRNKDFYVTLESEYLDYYDYCISDDKCEPSIRSNESNSPILVNQEGIKYVCAKGANTVGETTTECLKYRLDKTKPVVGNIVFTGTQGLDNWYIGDVLVSNTKSTDALSGIASNTLSPTETSITVDTKGKTYTLTARDLAGNESSVSYTVKVDKTAPTVGELVISGTKGDNGWYKSDVKFSVKNGSDSMSGHASTTSSISSITKDTKGTKVILTTKDKAGNTSTKEYTIKMDKTAPTAGTATFAGTLSNGWYTTNVTVNVTNGSDATSGHASTKSNVTSITYNTARRVVTITTTDNAGNSSTRTYTIKVDKNAPTLTAKGSNFEIKERTDKETSTYFNSPTYSISGGSMSCSPINIKSLEPGTYTLACTATGGNGLKTIANTELEIIEMTLVEKIKYDSPLIASNQTWTREWRSGDSSGLYSESRYTLDRNTTYYFRGQPDNNIKFAGLDWKIIRINEDGSVRIMLASNIGNNKFHSKYDSSYTYTYYTNSELKSKIDTWYNNNISPYSSKLASNTNKFCQTSRTAWKTAATTNGNASLTLKENYTPKYDCPTDANGYGKLSLNVGLITYDESIYAGGFYNSGVTYGYFMFNKADEKSLWSMSPAGVESGTNYGEVWGISYLGYSDGFYLASEIQTKPVINIKGELYVSGYGTSSDPYVVK